MYNLAGCAAPFAPSTWVYYLYIYIFISRGQCAVRGSEAMLLTRCPVLRLIGWHLGIPNINYLITPVAHSEIRCWTEILNFHPPSTDAAAPDSCLTPEP